MTRNFASACITKWRNGQRARYDGGEQLDGGYVVVTIHDGDVTTYAYEVHPADAASFFGWAGAAFAAQFHDPIRLVGGWPCYQIECASIAEAEAFAMDDSGEALASWENAYRPAQDADA